MQEMTLNNSKSEIMKKQMLHLWKHESNEKSRHIHIHVSPTLFCSLTRVLQLYGEYV